MSERFQPRWDRVGIAANTALAVIFGVAGRTSEHWSQNDLQQRIQSATRAGLSVQTAIQDSNYMHFSNFFGENAAQIMNNQLGDLTIIPFLMSSSRAMLGLIGMDNSHSLVDTVDATTIGFTAAIMLMELKDMTSQSCSNVFDGCIGDGRDLLAFSVPIISLAIYRRRGIGLALGHIFQHLNSLCQGRVGVE